MWSPKGGAVKDALTGETIDQVDGDTEREWVWSERMEWRSNARHIVAELDGHYFKPPHPKDPKRIFQEKWFADDWHHWSAFGHKVLAISLFNHLLKLSDTPLKPNKRVTQWGEEDRGDQCYNWFLTGKIPLPRSGGKIVTLEQNNKSFLEIEHDSDDGVVHMEFESKFNRPVQLFIGYMSQEQPSNYPRVDVTVNHRTTRTTRVFPNFNMLSTNPTAHITSYSNVGFAKPGHNTIEFRPLEQTNYPFRLLGIYMCATCPYVHPEEVEDEMHRIEVEGAGQLS